VLLAGGLSKIEAHKSGEGLHIRIVALNARFTHSSLAVFHVRNELERHCPSVTVEVCQWTINDSYYETLLRLSAGSPDYIFFSAAIWNSDRIEQLIHDLKICRPDCGFVVGGPQALVIRENPLLSHCTVVSGEMEAVGASFYRDLENRRLAPYYEGRFLQGGSAQKSLLVSPYREADFSTHLHNRCIYYESSRGCPFSCSYCLSSADHGVVHKELALVKRELAQILDHQPATLRFVDRTFNDRPERALAIWQFLLERPGDTLFHFEISPVNFTEEMFAFLQTVPAGRFQFEIGVQSTHPPTLKAVRRSTVSQVVLHTIKRLAQIGSIHLHADLILGLPFETKESFAHSFADLFATGAHYLQMGLLKLLPGTALSRDAALWQFVSCSRPPYAVMANQWLDHATLRELYWLCECVEKFVNNRYFPSFWEYLRRKGEDVFSFFQELAYCCQQENFFALAATQELMGRLLYQQVVKRGDSRLLLEILRYDWLRCGHRFLPSFLQVERTDEQPQAIKTQVHRHGMVEGGAESFACSDQGRTKRLFRQGLFLRFSRECLVELGLRCSGQSAVLVFLPEREHTIHRLQKIVVLEGIPAVAVRTGGQGEDLG